jgi:APA family basic amino acid/polyamine antiporter
MSHSTQKMGFWSVFSLVIGSQIGSGVFMLPVALAPFGMWSLAGWALSGVGAISLALVFAQLCAWFPKTGGPHVYVHEAFGKSAAFFTGWTYWIISWVSSAVVVISAVAYLMPLIGFTNPMMSLALQMVLLAAITLLNFRGASFAGRTEFFLALLKFIPLVFIPLVALCCFNWDNFVIASDVSILGPSRILSSVALLTFWCFIGVESATAPAGSVENPSKTIPRALVAGTVSVALLYVINTLAVMGIIPGPQLINSSAPYSDVVRQLFGGSWHLIIAAISSVVCISTLNVWTLTSGQIALGLAQDTLLPAAFGKTNKFGAPFWSLAISYVGIALLLILTTDANLATQLRTIIDFSVIAFLFVYAMCCVSFFKILWSGRASLLQVLPKLLYGALALGFCMWVIYDTPLSTLGIASLFTLSGLPFYVRLCRR